MPETRIRLLSTSAAYPTLPDGVYLNLPEEPYFAQPRMGSTDLCKLFLRKEGYWWVSDMNPHKPAEEVNTNARMYGRALHKAVLEGVKAFEASVFVMPTKDAMRALHGENFCVTQQDILDGLERAGANPPGGKAKPFYIAAAKTRAPHLVIWDTVEAAAKEEGRGKILLDAGERRDILLVTDLIHNHPDLEDIFRRTDSAVPLSEVTILWTDEHGLRRRARIDLMLPDYMIDLKSLFNVGNRALSFATGERVAEEAYHVQFADHMAARRWALHLIQQGKVYDGTYEDLRTEESQRIFQLEKEWLGHFPTRAVNSDYGWIFIQKPDAKKGAAPIVFPWKEDLGGDLHRRGIRCRREAIATYRRCMEQFGAATPWTRVETVHTSDEEVARRTGMGRVVIPHWIGGNEKLPDEEDDF